MCNKLALVLAVAAIFSFGLPWAGENALQLYVAPNGSDAWSGTLPEPNEDGTDGPFATVSGARDALRRLKEAAGLPGPVSVQLRDGTYRIAAPIVFEPQDTGTPAAPERLHPTGPARNSPGNFTGTRNPSWHPVPVAVHAGMTPANLWGLIDMHCNVQEWRLDWY